MKEKRKVYVAPSILSADYANVATDVESVTEGGADVIHCDVMDGCFVDNISFGSKMIADVRKITKLPIDAHLMIVQPQRYIKRFAEAGADFITIHVEACDCVEKTLKEIKAFGKKCGVVINPETDVEAAMPYIELCDMILVMSVHPGFGGQTFLPEALDKIRTLRREIDLRGLDCLIEIDGGINAETAKMARQAGTDVIVAGSYVFSSKDRAKAINSLR